MAATDEQKAILSVLCLLLAAGEKWIQDQRRVPRQMLLDVQRQFTPLKETELKNYLLYRRSSQFPNNRVIYIKPPKREKTAVAAVWCRWNFDAELSSCGFQFGIWSAQDFPNAGACRKRTVFVGFRYETPENGKTHNYYHAQPCQSIGGREKVVSALPISPRNPTFPLAAKSSLELLLCLVMSVYGMDGMMKLLSAVSNDPLMRQDRYLNDALRKMHDLGT